MVMVWCSKKESPKQVRLPTEVIRQTPPQEIVEPWWQDTVPQEQEQPVSNQPQENPVEEFDPVVFEEENDEIQELVDMLEELIEEQEW